MGSGTDLLLGVESGHVYIPLQAYLPGCDNRVYFCDTNKYFKTIAILVLSVQIDVKVWIPWELLQAL